MSSILLEGSTEPIFVSDDTSDGLKIVGQQNEANEFKLDETGEFDLTRTNDQINGGSRDDIIFAGAGDDAIFGLAGNDYLDGEEGNDTLQGEEGNDILRGGAGDDFLRGGRGSDTMIGGAGSDMFEFFSVDWAEGELDVIKDFGDGDDLIVIKGVDEGVEVTYHETTGIVSVGEEEIIKLDNQPAEDDITIENNDGNWELF